MITMNGLFLLLVGVVTVFVVTVDASTLTRNNDGLKNQKVHIIADVTCSKESAQTRHHRRRNRRNLGSILDLDNLFEDTDADADIIERDIEIEIESNDVYGVMAGTIFKPSSSGTSSSDSTIASGASSSSMPQIAVSITINPDAGGSGNVTSEQLCTEMTQNINGFISTSCFDYLITGWMNLCDETLNEIEELSEVTFVKPTSSSRSTQNNNDPNNNDRFTGSGSVKSQAIAALQITTLLEQYPGLDLTGEGLKIGIISNSYDQNINACTPKDITEQDDIQTGNLPSGEDGSSKVIVLNDGALKAPGQCSNDEGRAMAQLIYDLIPGVQLYFYTGFLFGNFAEAINALVEVGCDVIVDDIRFFEEPVYQLGLTAKAAEAAAEQGVQYYSSAGNTFDNSYEARYKGIPCGPEIDAAFLEPLGTYRSCHDFGGGNVKQRIDVNVNGPTGNLTLYWDQPWASISGPPGTQLDFDFYLFKENKDQEKPFISSSINDNFFGDAFEEIVFDKKVFENDDSSGIFDLVIPYFGGPGNPDPEGTLMKWISFGTEFNSVEPGPINSATITGPANTPNVAAVAAAFSQQTFGQLEAESFTALGGIPLLFDNEGNRYPEPLILPQPRFTGPDGDFTTFFGSIGFGISKNERVGNELSDSPPRFFGTSASAPSVSAVGIILLQACKQLTEGGGQRLDGSFDEGEGEVRETVKSTKAPTTKKSKRKKAKKTTSPTTAPTDSPTLPPFDCSLPANIFRILEETSIDMNEVGFDFLTGTGFVNALAAIELLIELVDASYPPSNSYPTGPAALMNANDGQQCPIPNFLFPIESFFDKPFNPGPFAVGVR